MAKFLDNSGLATVFSIIKRHIPTKTSDLTNDSGFITDAGVTSFNGDTGDVTYTAPVTSVNGDTGAVSLDADAIPYNGSQSVFEKISEIVTQGGEPNVIETVEQNGTPLTVTNKTVNVLVPTATSDLTNDSNYVSDADYVHTDNNYTTTEKNKLSGIASGAEVNVQSDWNVSDNTSDAYIKNKPTIPTVNNATLTIQKNSATVNTFTANASTDVTVDISVPTKTSDLTNDSDFVSDASYVHTDNNYTTTDKNKLAGIASGAEVNVQSNWTQTDNTKDDFIKNKPSIPSKTSDLTNDSGYLTSSNAVTSFNGSTGAVTYTAPVTSVNSETGVVVLDATDIAYDSNNTVKEKIDAIISGGGEPNVIEVVEVNGTALTVTDKTVDVPVPTESTVAGWGFTKNTGTYSKPSTGIPKTDLASGVQDSLDLADTAVQTETDPTVPSWAKASSKPSYSGSIADATTGISIADHSSTTIYGVDSSTTTASKVTVSGGNGSAPTLGTAFTVPNVTAVGSGSFTQGAFSGGSFSATVTDHEMSFSFTAATHGTDSHTHVVPTLGTAFTVPNVTSVGSASTWSISASDVTVPIKDVTSTTVVTSKTHTVTDNGHTHTITIS